MRRWICLVLSLLLLSACAAEDTSPEEALPWEYLQLASYMQDGLRAYDVEETATLYFAPWEGVENCAAPPEGEGWQYAKVGVEYASARRAVAEYFVRFDRAAETCEIVSENEAILAGLDQPSTCSFEETAAAADARLTLSRETELHVYPHYLSPVVSGTFQASGEPPIRRDRYTDYYFDPRLDKNIAIAYPGIYQDGGTTLTDRMREAAYHGWSMEELTDRPNCIYSVDYQITRDDERYFSVAFVWFGFARGDPSPYTTQYAVTIDRETEQPVALLDLLGLTGEEMTALFRSDVFLEPEPGFDRPDKAYLLEELAKLDGSADQSWSDVDFYLTDDSLVLLLPYWNYQQAVEAPLSALPLQF